MKEALSARAALAECSHAPDRFISVLGEKWIPCEGRCLPSARRFVRDVVADWGAAEDVPEVAELLASELVTNALTHGAGGTHAIRVTVSREGELLVVDVHDTCPALPRLRLASQLDLSGRGLAIVQTFSHDWGWTVTPYDKSVWFQLIAWSGSDGPIAVR
ncbi:ATP-binding protein [Nonomuraea glycinis]|uniref:ATP-binding protein n=1 Tax=Nonomuraea glycinis TaxID=2047744 RepID=UPI0033A32F60